MSVLVTGGAGYIGSHTVRLLVSRAIPVVVLDTLELGRADHVRGAPLVVGDVADKKLVASVVADHQVSAVVHFAAYKAAGESVGAPGRYFSNNVGGTAAMLEVLADAGVSKFVFSSSCAVYGTPEKVPVDEESPIAPESPYGETKAITERMLAWFDTCLGMRYVSLRYFNAAGAATDGSLGEDWDLTQNLVPMAMKALLGRRPPLEVYGTDYPTPDGTAVRDYIHVEDLADAHLKALQYLDGGGPSVALNVGTGVGSSVRQVLEAAGRVAGRPVPARDAPRRPGDPARLWADNSRAKRLLGWQPRFGLEEIVSSAWAWHCSQVSGGR